MMTMGIGGCGVHGGRKVKGMARLIGPAVALLALSCVPAYKANIDYTLSGEIVWPPPPEPGRIRYLWSLTSLMTGDDDLFGLLFGPEAESVSPMDAPYLMRPFGLFVDSGKALYIVDQGPPRITVVNLEDNSVRHIGTGGEGLLAMPIDIAADGKGSLYVTDSEAGKVYIYSDEGRFKGYLGPEGLMKRPTGIAFERVSGNLYVIDTFEHRVNVFDAAGDLVGGFGRRGGGDGEFNYPTHIFAGSDGKLYVTDALNFRIQVFDADGRFLFKFGRPGDSFSDLNRPKGVAADSYGNVYVVDNAGDMVKIFNSEGKLLLYFGKNGRLPGMFVMPSGIFIDENNRIYVADTYNMRIQVFQLIKGDG